MGFKIFGRVSKYMLGSLCMAIVLGVFGSCSDSNDTQSSASVPFDPKQPVVVKDFEPKDAGALSQLLVYGSNFGTDKDRIKLYVGGKEAVVINVMSDKLYAFVPAGAFGSKIEVAVTDAAGNELKRGVSPESTPFNYKREVVAGTLCGYKTDRDDQGEVYGPFETTTGFRSSGCMTIDPLYPNRIYVVYDGANRVVQLDLDARTHTQLMSSSPFQNQRMRNCAFTNDGQYMIMSVDVWGDSSHHSPSLYILKRNADGTFDDSSSVNLLASFRQCNGVAVHPVNGEVYFNSYENGQFFRLDLEKYFRYMNGEERDSYGRPKDWTGYYEDGCYDELFQIADPSWEYNIMIHPTGNYAYINVINRAYILRTDYDWSKKCFTTPYLVCGKANNAGLNEGVGGDARINTPYQGVFVKNPDYAGRADEYDYIFTDKNNYCIRKLTPDGMCRIWAGRSPSSDNLTWGADDGALRTKARFVWVTGICYYEDVERFYILDDYNRKVRTIGKEGDEAAQ